MYRNEPLHLCIQGNNRANSQPSLPYLVSQNSIREKCYPILYGRCFLELVTPVSCKRAAYWRGKELMIGHTVSLIQRTNILDACMAIYPMLRAHHLTTKEATILLSSPSSLRLPPFDNSRSRESTGSHYTNSNFCARSIIRQSSSAIRYAESSAVACSDLSTPCYTFNPNYSETL